jgi:FkbM family methyltransferase
MWLLERKNVFRFLSEILPESKFKEHLKSVLYEGLRLAKMESLPVKNWESIDGRLILEFENGLKLVSNVYRRENAKSKQTPLVDTLYDIFVRNFYTRFQAPKAGETVVDAGANIGVFTILAAKLVGERGRVIAIEPERKNLKNLRNNLKINGLKNVSVVPKGLWSRREKKKLYLNDANPGAHTLVGKSSLGDAEEIEVDTLDNILEELGVTRVDFIKMDIEGGDPGTGGHGENPKRE